MRINLIYIILFLNKGYYLNEFWVYVSKIVLISIYSILQYVHVIYHIFIYAIFLIPLNFCSRGNDLCWNYLWQPTSIKYINTSLNDNLIWIYHSLTRVDYGWRFKEMFDKIIGSGVKNYTNLASSVHTEPNTHKWVCIKLLKCHWVVFL